MIKVIRSQAVRLVLTYLLLAGLVVWQREFIIAGIRAHVQLNLLIIGVFLFGSVLNARNLIKLRNDVVAYTALRTVFEDAQARQFGRLTGEELRSRCLTPGVVYKSSELLGPVFDLTLENLLRSKHMRISIATMQNLTGAIDGRIAHQKTLANYLSSMCIFLGLIGTFIGLMEMVGSVGGIIGGLANSEAGSSDSMRALIRNLEAPLTGMASGFSASLFGLFGSLMLGVGARFVSVATHAIREEFEHWLASVSQLGDEKAAEGSAALPGPSSVLLHRIASALRANTDRLEQQIELVERTARQLDRAARAEQNASMALSRVEHLQAEISKLREENLSSANSLRFAVLDGFERLSRSAQEQNVLTMAELSRLGTSHAHSTTALAELAAAAELLLRVAGEQHASLMADLTQVSAAQAQTQASLEQMASSALREAARADQRHESALAEVSKLAAANAEVGSAIVQLHAAQDRAARQIEEHRAATLAEMANLSAGEAQTRAAITRVGEKQDRALSLRDEKQEAALAEIARLALVQDQANGLLVRIAGVQAAQPEQGAVTAVVTQTVSAAIGQLSQTMDETIRSISREIGRLAEEQRKTTLAVSQTPEDVFRRELGELARSLQNGINAGMTEVAQTLEATVAAQTEALLAIRSTDGMMAASERPLSRMP